MPKDKTGKFANEPPAVRFWRRVDAGPACWKWRPARGRNIYGRFSIGHQSIGAHKFSWTLHHGPIPDGMFVLHRCDNRDCVNPDHLFLGTNQDNVNDMVAKGRHQAGTRHYRAKLTVEQAAEIRGRYQAGQANQYELADAFGVSQKTIFRVVRRGYLKETA